MSEARSPWNKVSIDEGFIRENFYKMSAREIGERLGVSRELINHRVRKMGLRKTKIPYVPLQGEILKPIIGVPDYGVTNKSRVVSLETMTLLKQKIGSTGYPMVTLFPRGKRVDKRVHRIVAECFLPNPNAHPVVNHLDGNKTNSSIDNLEWTTVKGNSIHALESGLLRVGEDAPGAKITEAQALIILDDYAAGLTNRQICEKYPFTTKSIVEKLTSGERWKHLKRPFERATTSRKA